MDPEYRYKKLKVLKEGGFGKAFLAEDQSNYSLCVVKETKTSSMSKREIEEIKTEANILKALKHPNIISFRDVYMNKKKRICIAMDYADAGDLSETISKADTYFSEEQILDWFTQLCLAVKHIHDRKIVHRDLKAQNIFLTRIGMVKLGDFGISKILTHTQEFLCTFVGTWYYISPEIIMSKPYNFKTDIWSLGVILYEMCCLRLPFRGANQFILQRKIKSGKYNPIPLRYSRELKALVSDLLVIEPRRRPSIYQILAKGIIKSRVGRFLSERVMNDEFSHTVIHGGNVLNDARLRECGSENLVGIKKLSRMGLKRHESDNHGEPPRYSNLNFR